MSNAKPTNIFDELIQHMKLCGWVVQEDGSLFCEGCTTIRVNNDSETERWIAAMKACFEVATGA